MKSEIRFADEKLKNSFEKLKKFKSEEKKLYEWICRAFGDLKEDAFCGIQIPKKLIPRDYIKKYKIDNAWKYDLPRGWRLIYSIANSEICVLSIILEWMDHKNYEKRFKY
jgi:Txe/YoeB family toxin of Txe-Axe toxin-antitoxin module